MTNPAIKISGEEAQTVARIARKWPRRPLRLYRIPEGLVVALAWPLGWSYRVRPDGTFSTGTGRRPTWA